MRKEYLFRKLIAHRVELADVSERSASRIITAQ
jgi:hypothetical protein